METARLLEGATRENQRLQLQLEGTTRENQRLQLELEGAVRYNEDRGAMFVAAKRDVAIMQAKLQLGAKSRVDLEVRIGTLEKERKFLFGALFVCSISGCFLDDLDHVSQCGVSLGVVVVVVSRIHVGTGNLLVLLWVVYQLNA